MIRLSVATASAAAMAALATPAQAGPFDIPEDQQTTYIDLGAAVVSRASYVGSEDTETDIFPYLAGEYEGRVFANAAQGLGVNLINNGKLQVAGIGFFASGRDADNTPFLDEDDAAPEMVEDAFDVTSSVTAGGLVSYRFPYAQLELQGQIPVTGDVEGWRLDATLATRLVPLERIIGEGTIISPGIRASYLSDEWTETYYGITQAQSNALQGRTFGPAVPLVPGGFEVDGGFNSYSLFTLTSLSVTDDITLVGVVNYTLLAGDAKDSPLSPENDALTLVAGVAKRF